MKYLDTRNGVILCPICKSIAFIHSFRVDAKGIERRKRRCLQWHVFCTSKVLGSERLEGDVIHLPTLIKQVKKGAVNG